MIWVFAAPLQTNPRQVSKSLGVRKRENALRDSDWRVDWTPTAQSLAGADLASPGLESGAIVALGWPGG